MSWNFTPKGPFFPPACDTATVKLLWPPASMDFAIALQKTKYCIDEIKNKRLFKMN
jgi:hypothetical protein